jgi:hypothetical protein
MSPFALLAGLILIVVLLGVLIVKGPEKVGLTQEAS